MNNFFNALTKNNVLTENGMFTNSSSGSFVLDFIYRMGATRTGFGLSRSHEEMDREIVRLFNSAFQENRDLAVKSLFYLRDIRGGMGERRLFRLFWRKLCLDYPEIAVKNIPNVPFYGRWDDLLIGLDSPVEDQILDYILFTLKSGDKNSRQLCAKWMPRENKKLGEIAKYMMNKWEISPKDYRLLLSGNTKVVENLMCKNRWDEINYPSVPSRAMFIYKKAFRRHDSDGFEAFLAKVKKGELKIQSKTLFPHEIAAKFWRTSISKEDEQVLNLMWENLEDFIPEGLNYIPIVDVSGSMTWQGGLPFDVALGIGLYTSERNKSIFKNGFITFSDYPSLHYVKGTLSEKMWQIGRFSVGGSTNLEAVFNLILRSALENNLKREDMPNVILIISDMQFNQCTKVPSDSALSMIKRMYYEAGYEFPTVVFWNVRNSEGIPAKGDDKGVLLVSGFSPSLMKYMLAGKMSEFTPLVFAEEILLSGRYERVIC